MSLHDTDFEPVIDARQRAMLEAMGITVWQPQVAVEAVNFKEKMPLAHAEYAQDATKSIALKASADSKLAPAPITAAIASAQSTPLFSPLPSGTAQMDGLALRVAVSSCQACALCESRKSTVFGAGHMPTDASQAAQLDWLIVGEAPGEQEDLQGEPFVGPAGKLLDNMLSAMKMNIDETGQRTGLSRSKGVYITNVLKCRPPANRNPSPPEIAMCEPYLARQIELLRPKIVIAMGKFAISSLTGSSEPVGKLRGRVHALNHASYKAPVIVTYHPAYLLRNLPDKAKAWADLLLAMQTFEDLAKR
jgi:uracil-DNA glycosylase